MTREEQIKEEVNRHDWITLYAVGFEAGAHWVSNEAVFGSRVKTAEAYADIFRTTGEMKKAIRRLKEMKEQAQ